VAFFGFGGPGFGAGFGFGNIGWVALAPFEHVYPWWGRGFYSFNRGVNVANVNIYNTYRNARTANGIAAVRAEDFNAGRFGNIARYNGTQIREAGLVHGQLPVAPAAANLRYASRAAGYVPRGGSGNVRFFSRNPLTPVQRVPLAQQQRAMQQMSRQAVTATASMPHSAVAGGQASWRPVSPPAVRPATPERSSSGWTRFGEPRQAAPATNSFRAAPATYRSVPAPSSLRIAPPVVRERSAPRPSGPSGGGSRGGGSAPRGGGGGSHGGGGGHR